MKKRHVFTNFVFYLLEIRHYIIIALSEKAHESGMLLRNKGRMNCYKSRKSMGLIDGGA